MFAETTRPAGPRDIRRGGLAGRAGLRAAKHTGPQEAAQWWAGSRDRLQRTAETFRDDRVEPGAG